MTDFDDGRPVVADRKADVTLSEPLPIGQGYMVYERYEVSLRRDGEPPLLQRRDVLRATTATAVLAIDLERDQLVLIRQFRIAAHLANGCGDMVEIAAGRVDPGETAYQAARRECLEEIGVAPARLVELFTVVTAPGFSDEQVVFFAGFIDASAVLERGGLADETEDTQPFVVSIDEALAVLEHGGVYNALLYSALQWLAINRARLPEFFSRAV